MAFSASLMDRFSVAASSMKEALRVSPWFNRAFSSASIRLAARKARRGENLPALKTLFRAWRTARAEGFPVEGKELMWEIVRRTCFEDEQLAPIGQNALLKEFQTSPEAESIRERFRGFPKAEQSRLRLPRSPDSPERQGNLIALKKYDPTSGERGVLLLKYGESFFWFTALFDLEAVAKRYTLVLEPCWAGYQDWRFLIFLGSDLNAVVLSPHPVDFDFIDYLDSNLVPVRLGAGDWVDPDSFTPEKHHSEHFDLVMVSSWNPLKRHSDFFAALAKLKEEGYRKLRVALVGSPTVWSREKIESMIDRYDLSDSCTVYENIPHARVAEIVASSSAFVLASRQEGANKALYEALFCDTPVLIYSEHRSVNPDHIGSDVGIRFASGELDKAIRSVLEAPDRFSPRKWALEHTGWPVATEQLEALIRGIEERADRAWTRSIAAKKNAPHLRYAETGKYREFESEYERLHELMVISS